MHKFLKNIFKFSNTKSASAYAESNSFLDKIGLSVLLEKIKTIYEKLEKKQDEPNKIPFAGNELFFPNLINRLTAIKSELTGGASDQAIAFDIRFTKNGRDGLMTATFNQTDEIKIYNADYANFVFSEATNLHVYYETSDIWMMSFIDTRGSNYVCFFYNYYDDTTSTMKLDVSIHVINVNINDVVKKKLGVDSANKILNTNSSGDIVTNTPSELNLLLKNELLDLVYPSGSIVEMKNTIEPSVIGGVWKDITQFYPNANPNTKKWQRIVPVDSNKSSLQKTYDSYKDIDQNLYTEATYEPFAVALEKAKTVLDDPEATQTTVDDTNRELLMAYVALRLKPTS